MLANINSHIDRSTTCIHNAGDYSIAVTFNTNYSHAAEPSLKGMFFIKKEQKY